MSERYPEQKQKAIMNWSSQIWPSAHEMKKGDLVVLPLKTQRAIQIGEITGECHFEPKGPSPYFQPQTTKLKEETFKGWELVQAAAGLCAITNRQDRRLGRTQVGGEEKRPSMRADPGICEWQV